MERVSYFSFYHGSSCIIRKGDEWWLPIPGDLLSVSVSKFVARVGNQLYDGSTFQVLQFLDQVLDLRLSAFY